MKNKLKKFLLPLGIVSVIFILAVINIVQDSQKHHPGSTPEAISPQSALVQTIVPDKTFPLQPGKKQSFTVTLNPGFDPQSMQITMTRSDFIQNSAPVAVRVTRMQAGQNTIILTMQDPILGYNQYTITIAEKNAPLYSISYLSDRTAPTKILTNNHALAAFLPYETDTFKLSFDSFENLYVFNFTYNVQSSLDLQTQYQNAKQNALNFITGKSIDPNTVIVDWRYH